MNGQSPDNLVLAQLAGIRTLLHSMDERLREHSARFTAVEARLGAIEQRLDIWNERMLSAFVTVVTKFKKRPGADRDPAGTA